MDITKIVKSRINVIIALLLWPHRDKCIYNFFFCMSVCSFLSELQTESLFASKNCTKMIPC